MMKLRFLCTFFLFIAFAFSDTVALKCYSCDSHTEKDCFKPANVMQCPKPAPRMEAVCYYRRAYDTYYGGEKITAACGVVEKYQLLQDLAECRHPPYNLVVTDCSMCSQDLCNSKL